MIIVNAIYQRCHQDDLDARFVQVIDCAELDIKKIPDLPVTVRIVADAIELKVDVTQAGFSSLATKLLALGEFNPVGGRLYRIVTDFARVLDRFDEVRRDCRLAT